MYTRSKHTGERENILLMKMAGTKFKINWDKLLMVGRKKIVWNINLLCVDDEL